MFSAGAVVMGAGVVGLATAAALARAGIDTILLEGETVVGSGVSSRNSEVIHSGLYYRTGSLKHRLCVNGRRQLYDYLAVRGVAHRKTGKLVVANSEDEFRQVEALFFNGQANDVEGLKLLSGAEATAIEPALTCALALRCEETGILDSHGLMLALLGELEDHGGAAAFRTPGERVEVLDSGQFLVHAGGAEPTPIRTRLLVNAGGLSAQNIAGKIDGLDPMHVPPLSLAKGSYFSCSAKPAFSTLIYPAPAQGGLGVHLTLDLAGRMRFGPDVEWLDETDPARLDMSVDPARSDSFYEAIRRYWRGLPDGSLAPDYAGCRPKLSRPGEAVADFRIDGPERHGLEGLVNLFGIESPGMTSALAIADEVVLRLKQGAGRARSALDTQQNEA